MKSDDKFGMRPQWDALLAIYKEFSAICLRHGLRQWIAEGNMIGALRHKGFVPWDDDIDVIMPRPDYEKFVAVANAELPQNLRYWDWHDVPEWRFNMGKVQEIRPEAVLAIEKKVGHTLSNGIYIDILILDGFPSTWMAGVLYKLKMRLLGTIGRYRRTKLSSYRLRGKLEWIVGCFLSFFWPNTKTPSAVMNVLEQHMKSIPFENSKLTWRTGSAMRVTMTFPREVWNGTVMKEFDEIQVPLPIGYDLYLRTQYGDYMKLPPKDMQKPSHAFDGFHFPWWLGPAR